MKKAPLYSRSPTRNAAPRAEPAPDAAPPVDAPLAAPSGRRSRLKSFVVRHERQLWATALLLFVICGLALNSSTRPGTPPLTMKQIDYAMRKSIEETPLSSPAAKAYDAVIPSVINPTTRTTDGITAS